MKRLIAIAAVAAALSFAPPSAEAANCRPLRAALRVVAAPVRLVVRAQPLRRAARLVALPVRGVGRLFR
jgi:hypothetical protein